MNRRLAAAAVAWALAAGAAVLPDDVAEGLFRTAQQLERGGQTEQAREAYARVVEQAPRSERADDALLALARLAWPIAEPEQLGTAADTTRWAEARGHLARIVTEYARADSAPEALWRLGLLLLDPDGPERDPDDATARLLALPELYPDAPRAPQALALVAMIDAGARRDGRALENAFRVLWAWPAASGAASQAWLAAGEVSARGARTELALVCLGRAGTGSGEAARRAVRLAALVDRIASGAGREAWKIDLDRQLALPERVDDLAAAPDGRLFAAMERENAVAEIDPSGARASRRPMAGVIGVALDAWSRPWLLTGEAIVGPAAVGRIALPEDVDATALAIVGARGLWLADSRGRRVVRLAPGGTIEAAAPLAGRGDPRALAPGTDGGVVVLDARNRRILRFDARGAPAGRIELAGTVGRPVDVDVDRLGALYVLDADGQVVVLDRKGALVARVALPRDGERAIARPERLAVDEAGRIAVADGRRRRITWLR
ncbi:MAG: hypothetical protein D6738_08160 [Acidobacteria bacterium]|nr:MAG: hypothetical protein D6738_08160 [Acidobacteriota bacterium]